MYIEKLTIQNLRIFEKAEVHFNYPSLHASENGEQPSRSRPLENVNLFLGDNGSGKTSLCRGIVLAALRPLLSVGAGLRLLNLVRVDSSTIVNPLPTEINIDLILSNIDYAFHDESPIDSFKQASIKRPMRAVIDKRGDTEFLMRHADSDKWKFLYFEDHPAMFVTAYGASRRTERPEAYNELLRGLRYQRVASLFESHVGLLPITQAFSICEQINRWDEVATLLDQLLPQHVTIQHDSINQRGEPLFDSDGVRLPLESLSDGYRIFIGWLVDLLTHLARVAPEDWKLTDLPGVVIVDEVDLFLHPSWQRTVIRSLSETFPRLQFFFTTHSPIVAATLERHNVYLVERVAPHTAAIRQPSEKFAGRSIDEVLVRLFGLASPRSPELEKQLSNLADRAMEGDFEASLEYLRRLRVGVEGE